jgi:hypothetical protein
MERHYRTSHPSGRKHGRPSAITPLASSARRWTPASCQRFFV